MLGVGVLGIIGVALTIWITLLLNAENSKDTAGAIAQMASIANSMAAERPAIERQANAAADSAKAAKDSAEAAIGQTDATIKQANALIRSAQATVGATTAQLSAAQAQLVSAQANTRTAEAGAKAAQLQQHSAVLLSASRAPVAKLSSVQLSGWLDDASKDGTVKIKVRPTYSNVGGGTLLPGFTTFNLIVSDRVPSVPTTTSQNTFGGNENPINAGGQFYPVKEFTYLIAKADIEAVNRGKKGVIVWGVTKYNDTTG